MDFTFTSGFTQISVTAKFWQGVHELDQCEATLPPTWLLLDCYLKVYLTVYFWVFTL